MSKTRKVLSRRNRNPKDAALRRLPGNFSWKLLRLLREQLSTCGDLDDGKFDAILLTENATELAEYRRSFCPNPSVLSTFASSRLQVDLCKKDPTMCSIEPVIRRAQCLQRVIDVDNRLHDHPLPQLDNVFATAKQVIREIIGTCPTVEDIANRARHGPGSTVHIGRNRQNRYFKYCDWPYKVNQRARDLLKQVIQLDNRWMGALEDSYRERFNIPTWCILDWKLFWDNVIVPCNYNRITAVPKDGTKDRPIAIEPEGNIYLQLGIEGVIRDGLKRVGINLDSQERNRELARIGSIDRSGVSPATIDLSDASDTISLELVALLLPQDWFDLLVSVRSPYGLLPSGTALRYAKMSSMGNGYTFALESLVFYSIVYSYIKIYGDIKKENHLISVYGDDIIFPNYHAAGIKAYLRVAGFTVNTKKSFLTGSFKESCGSDYLDGHDVRPVYISSDGIVRVDQLISLRNRLHRWFVRQTGCSIPEALDNFFKKYIENFELVPIGPESDNEFDSWWHDQYYWSRCRKEFVLINAYIRKVKEKSARNFLFRKLMHDLRSCEGDGGRFRVTTREEGTLRRSLRTVYADGYRVNGVLQDHARPVYAANAE